MPGFNFFYNKESIEIKRNKNLVLDEIRGNNYQINRFTLEKFLEDKLFIDNETIIIVLEGVILNKKELLKKYNFKIWSELVIFLAKENSEFFNEFRGTFTGLTFYKERLEWIIYADQLSSKHLYYFQSNSALIVSSEIEDLYIYFKENNIDSELDIKAANNLLSYGYMLNNDTLSLNVRKFEAGTFLNIKNNQFEIKQYYKLPLAPKKTNLSESEILKQVDIKFRTAIKRQFDKDVEYNYKHLVALSGGLDSRMTSWVAHEMGYENQLNFTFSQTDYLDETIPKKIATDLKHEWIFKALDNGIFLKDIEEINRMTGGNVLYYGLAHGNSMLKYINFEELGMFHTGMLGDVVIGSFVNNFSPKALQNLSGAYSKNNLINENKDESPEAIENRLIYQRGINGANNGLIALHKYSESMSPFYDIDFFEFCLSIPIHLRMNHDLYKKWILKYYPKSADYIWEKTKSRIDSKVFKIKIKGHLLTIPEIISIGSAKLGLIKTGISSKNHMNPLEYWYTTNPDIKLFQDNYFKININNISDKNLKEVCTDLYNKGNALQKNQALSLIAAIKLFF
ncbi:hypothetical protein [Flavobacterium sp. SM2513]|uniref:hypothetical protein n=1 Tax=Flavobacterium sp. SM2513 TaxID=3424766 RepID=UPI003D7FAD48